MAPKVVSQS
jgi:hypothetical protein